MTQFSDGRTVFTDHADFTLTNVETGATYVQHTNATFTDTFTADGNIFEVLDGRYFFGFLPGDQGPDGKVGEGGASFILVGHFEYTYDPDTNLITSFQADGRAIDLCQTARFITSTEVSRARDGAARVPRRVPLLAVEKIATAGASHLGLFLVGRLADRWGRELEERPCGSRSRRERGPS